MRLLPVLLLLLASVPASFAQPATRPSLPHVEVDVAKKQVRVECEAVMAQAPLEFLVCLAGTKEHEAVFRTKARPSHVHLALLLIGLEPGSPMLFDARSETWSAPRGPRLSITAHYAHAGQPVAVPAHRFLFNPKTKQEMADPTWTFAGSRHTPERDYAADTTGELISVVNFPDTMIDVAASRSNRNESLEYVVNPNLPLKRGTRVWLVLEAAKE
jgi:hypothetical protein